MRLFAVVIIKGQVRLLEGSLLQKALLLELILDIVY